MTEGLRINPARLLQDLRALGEIGANETGGLSRTAMSPADVAARAWFEARAREAGLAVRRDGAGNLSAVLPGSDPQGKTLLLGSHLDTVPNGGRFDGALGVLSALEALRVIREAGIRPALTLEAISFTDEEGTHVSLLGSRAAVGALTPGDLERPRSDPESFQAGMARLGISPQSILAAARQPQDLTAYLEVHIEQGSRLERSGIDIGVVTSIVGIRSYWLTFNGQAAHAGTTPMDERSDALWGAAAFVGEARRLVRGDFAPGVVNVGQIQTTPGSFNIVPGQARLALEFRHGTEAQMEAMQAALLARAEDVAAQFSLTLNVEQGSPARCAPMDEGVMRVIEGAAEALGLSRQRMMSFAGHDAQSMSRITPAGMLFVPSVGGISHNPGEYTKEEDVVKGAEVLLGAVIGVVSEKW